MTDWSSAYDEHGPAVLAYLRRRTGRVEEAEDLCQETFARVVNASTPLRRESSVRAYLFQTAHNLLVNHLRRPHSRVRIVSDMPEPLELDEQPSTMASAEAEFDATDLAERVQAHLRTLPEDQRRAFRMAVLQGRRYADVARDMSWTVSKVKITVFRTRRALLAALERDTKD